MSYRNLYNQFQRIGQLSEVEAIVEWDRAVNMAEPAGESRAEALAGLAVVRHGLLTEQRVGDWLESAQQEALSDWDAANLREMRRAYQRASAVPTDLVEASSRACARCEQAWRVLRRRNAFSELAPLLDSVVRLRREVGAALASALGTTTYDALMDEYEPGARSAAIDVHFERLEAFLPEFTDQVIGRQRSAPPLPMEGPFSVDAQRGLAQRLMRAVGFDPARGRLDVSHHPFCGGTPQDVRITTRYDEQDFASALMGVLHESGHAKYEQGLPVRWNHQPVGAARGMVLHESQSLLLEMQVCRSREFAEFSAPLVREAFPDAVARTPSAFTADNLARSAASVSKSLIRVDADEVTYPAHVLLRYDLEKKLIGGQLDVESLPDAWDEGMTRLLGLSTAGNDRDGCMQDVHWPSGAFGYFPLYTLGAMAAAQLFAAAKRICPGIPEGVRRGEFSELDAWLREHVWSQASLGSTEEVMVESTGSTLSCDAFIEHLKQRYFDA